ncbi:MAG: 8-amino-7-oxononanoate synthase [Mariprofundaceae bacterium]|nr:8-amino-7-oxononanoate synthase [Mariprofundaceae bacterium]
MLIDCTDTKHDSRHWFAPIAEHRRRQFLASKQQGIYITLTGKSLVNFASNDYLGLRQHPLLKEAAIAAIEQDGIGSGASRLISGNHPQLHQLENEVAAWKGYESCLIVGSGMLANIGLIQALADRHTHIFSDKLNHASLLDGVRLSGAVSHRFAHCNYNKLDKLLQKETAKKRVIISDGVFSMDGDCADIQKLLQLADTHKTLLLIDDAHGIGCMGKQQRGLTADFAGHKRLIEVGTFGKAFGAYGAFILGTHELIEGLKQRMRTMIYSTALPTFIPAAMLAALPIIQKGDLQKKLQCNLNLFRKYTCGLNLLPSNTAIQALIIGQDSNALNASKALHDAGFFVPAIRPPTVQEGTSRLRITLSAAHTPEQIKALGKALCEAFYQTSESLS